MWSSGLYKIPIYFVFFPHSKDSSQFQLNQIAYPERYTYLEDPNVEHVDIFTKGTATVAANLRENLNMRLNFMSHSQIYRNKPKCISLSAVTFGKWIATDGI